MLLTPCCCSGCEQICCTVRDVCGPFPQDALFIKACNGWVHDNWTITDDTGTRGRIQGWDLGWYDYTYAGQYFSTAILPFPSSHLWADSRDCVAFKSAQGAYGIYWKFTDTSAVVTLRVFADVCPTSKTIDLGTVADGVYNNLPLANPWVDWEREVSPGCNPLSFSASFSGVPTRWGDGRGIVGLGALPHGSVTIPITGVTISAPTAITAYKAGVTVTAYNRTGTAVASCTTDGSGKCCIQITTPDQYWVGISGVPDGCNRVQCLDTRPEVNATCNIPCTSTVTFAVCGGVEVVEQNVIISDDVGPHALSSQPGSGLFTTGVLTATDGTLPGFVDSAWGSTCYDSTPYNYVQYQYKLRVSGSQIKCELWTWPIKACSYGGSLCGYYGGNIDNETTSALVKSWDLNVDPDCGGGRVQAVFTFPDNTTICGSDHPVRAPAGVARVVWLQGPANHVVCAGPICPVPRNNLSLSWSGPSPGSVTLTYNPPSTWSAPGGYVFGPTYGGLYLPGEFLLDASYVTWYTCVPFYIQYTLGSVVYTLTG